MKVFVLVCSLATLARASLEPAGYRPPGSYPQSRYLPASSSNRAPDNRYVPSSLGSSSHQAGNYANELSSALVVPSKNSPVPFSQYLPANRQSSEHHIAEDNFAQALNPSAHYPAPEIQHSFTQALPLGDYLPPKQSQPSNAYLTPNKHSAHSLSGFSGSTSGFAATEHYSGASSGHQTSSGGHYASGYGSLGSASSSSGYNYNAPENYEPAKYDFEYKVKDNYGNDYGHKESRNGENTEGVYTVLLPDGRRQIVHYEADSHGYRPTITYEEVGSQSGYNNQGYQY